MLVLDWSDCGIHLPASLPLAISSLRPYSIQIVLMFVNSRIPWTPNSLPCPDHLTPPNGSLGSEATMRLMNTIPASSSLMNRSRSLSSLVHARSEEHTSELQSR